MSIQSGKFESGQVFFPNHEPWLADLEAEPFAFPNSRHDDQVDSISQALAYKCPDTSGIKRASTGLRGLPWGWASPGYNKRHDQRSSRMSIYRDDNRILDFRPLPEPVKVWLQLPGLVLICTQYHTRVITYVLNNIYRSRRN